MHVLCKLLVLLGFIGPCLSLDTESARISQVNASFSDPVPRSVSVTAKASSISFEFRESFVESSQRSKDQLISDLTAERIQHKRFDYLVEWCTDSDLPCKSKNDGGAAVYSRTLSNYVRTLECRAFVCYGLIPGLKPGTEYFVRISATDIDEELVFPSEVLSTKTLTSKKQQAHQKKNAAQCMIDVPYHHINDHQVSKRASHIKSAAETSTDAQSFNLLTASTGITISGSSGDYTKFGYSGYAVNAAGDFNLDGYDDVLVSAPGCASNSGFVYLIFGGRSLYNIDLEYLNSDGVKYTGPQGESYIGKSVSTAGDFNGDGFSDFLVSFSFASVFVSSVDGTVSAISAEPVQRLSAAGSKVSKQHIESSSGLSLQSYDSGFLGSYYISGSSGGPCAPFSGYSSYYSYNYAECIFTVCPTTANEINSVTVSTCTTECVGYEYFFVYSDADVYEGFAYDNCGNGCAQLQFFTTATNLQCSNFSIYEFCASSECGGTVQVTIAPVEGVLVYKSGAFLIPGKYNHASTTVALTTDTSSDFYMYSVDYEYDNPVVSGVGDINSDGYDDFALAYPTQNVVYIVFGSTAPVASTVSSLTNGAGFCISGVTYSRFGTSVSAIGDFNGDGFSDFIIGAPYYDDTSQYNSYGYYYYCYSNCPDDRGISYIIYGQNSSYTWSNLDVDDELPAYLGITIIGAAIGDMSGTAVAGAGDVNNDGFDDVMIGAPGVNYNEGFCYVIFGGSGKTSFTLTEISQAEGIIIQGANADNKVGGVISSAGDVTGDGYDDMLLGGPSINSYSGETYLIYGGSSLTNIHLNVLTSSQGVTFLDTTGKNYETGYSVAFAGDMNRDEYADYIIGAPMLSIPTPAPTTSPVSPTAAAYQYPEGISFLLFGTPDITEKTTVLLASLTNIFSITGNSMSVSYNTGSSVTIVGDVNGDGYEDVLIGSPLAGNYYAGVTYLIFGQKSGFNGVNLNSITPGKAINITGGALIPQEYVYYYFNYTYTYDVETANLGLSSSGAGDFNHDGIPDFMISSSSYNYIGYVYLVFGSLTLDKSNIFTSNFKPTQGIIISDDSGVLNLGYSTDGIGDFNGDGIDDIVVGSLNCATNFEYAVYTYPTYIYCIGGSVAYVLYGTNHTSGTITTGTSIKPSEGFVIAGNAYEATAFGGSVTGIGNFDGDADGLMDVAISDAIYNNYQGVVYIIFGTTDKTALQSIDYSTLAEDGLGYAIYGSTVNSLFGYAISGIGDFNDDGYPDIIIGAPAVVDGSEGVVYIVYGGLRTEDLYMDDFTSSDGITISSGTTGDACGFSVSAAGDIDKDRFPDVIIGCPYLQDYAGASYIITGSRYPQDIVLSDLTSEEGYAINGAYSYDFSGYSVAGSADKTGNGIAVIGAPQANSEHGTAYIFITSPDGSFPNNQTIAPSHLPTSQPSSSPTSGPTPKPTKAPTMLPTQTPSKAPTPPPFWKTNGPIIGGILGPAVLGFIPVFFSKQICTYALDNWGSKVEEVTQVKRSMFKRVVYNGCKKVYLESYMAEKAAREEKAERDEKIVAELRATNDIEMSMIKDIQNGEDHGAIPSLPNRASTRERSLSKGFFSLKRTLSNAATPQASISSSSHSPSSASSGRASVTPPPTDTAENPLQSQNSQPIDRPSTESSSQPSSHPTSQPTSKPLSEPTSQPCTQPSDKDNIPVHCFAVYRIEYTNPVLNLLYSNPEALKLFNSLPDHATADTVGAVISTSSKVAKENLQLSSSTQYFSSSADPSTSLGPYTSTFLFCRQLVEYAPILQYYVKPVFVSPLFNDTLPRSWLITLHLAAGHAAAMSLPQEMVSNGLQLSFTSSVAFATRLYSSEVVNYLLKKDNDLNNSTATEILVWNVARCSVVVVYHAAPLLLFKHFVNVPFTTFDGLNGLLSVTVALQQCESVLLNDSSNVVVSPSIAYWSEMIPLFLDSLAVAYFGHNWLANAPYLSLQTASGIVTLLGNVAAVHQVSKTLVHFASRIVVSTSKDDNLEFPLF